MNMQLTFAGRSAWLAVTIFLAATTSPLRAQQLPLKRTIPRSSDPCTTLVGSSGASRGDDSSDEARALANAGYDAELLGDLRAARDAFVRAAPLLPRDDRLAYHLARAHEALGERADAAREYCRALAISPQSGNAADARQRLRALVESGAVEPSGLAPQLALRFDSAVRDASARRLVEADAELSRLALESPSLAEVWYDRGVVRMQAGRRADAAADLQRYLALRPAASDAPVVRNAVAGLLRPSMSGSTAFTRGLLLPGLGQAYTGRPLAAAGVLAVVGGAAVWAFQTRTEQRLHHFVDALGFPYAEPYQVRTQPNLVAGLSIAVAGALGAAFEASVFARRHAAVGRVASVSLVPTGAGQLALRVGIRTAAP